MPQNPFPYDPWMNPYPQTPPQGVKNTVQGLREALNKKLGLEQGSRLDKPMAAVQGLTDAIPSGSDMWDYLSKAPQAPKALPSSTGGLPPGFLDKQAAAQGTPGATAPPGDLSSFLKGPFSGKTTPPGSTTVPWGQDPSQVGGWIKQEQGPGMVGKEWADDQIAGQTTHPYISTEELYRGAYADPASRAPGSNQWNAEQLGDRTGDTEFERRVKLQPSEAANINASGGVEQQRLQGQAQRDVANIQGQTERDVSPLGQFLRSGGTGLPKNLQSASKSGFTLSREPQMPSGIYSKLTDAVFAAAQNPTQGFFNKTPSAASGALDAAISNAMAYVPGSDNIASFVQGVVNNPAYNNASWNEILQQENESGLNDEEQLIFRALLQRERGF